MARRRARRESRLRKEKAAADTSHHGFAPTERGCSLVQGRCMAHGLATTNAGLCARAASERAASPSERQRPSVPRESRLRKVKAAAAKLHHGLGPKERGLPPVQRPSTVHEATTTSAALRARMREPRVVSLLPRGSKRNVAPACATRKPAAQSGGRNWRVAPRSCSDGERPLAGAVAFYCV